MSKEAYRISLKSLARPSLDHCDEIADHDAMIGAIINDLAPDLIASNWVGYTGAAQVFPTTGNKPARLR